MNTTFKPTHIANPVKVEAYEIVSMGTALDGVFFIFFKDCNGRRAKAIISPEMTARYTPAHGDYYVIQSDGYAYINPKDVFERKYRPIPVPAIEVYSNPACMFKYCPDPEGCKATEKGCIHA